MLIRETLQKKLYQTSRTEKLATIKPNECFRRPLRQKILYSSANSPTTESILPYGKLWIKDILTPKFLLISLEKLRK